MKHAFKLVLVLTLALSEEIQACQCSEYPLSHDQVIKETIRNKIGRRAAMNLNMETDVEAIKAYPTLIERMDLARFRGTSCEVRGPQDEFLYHCIHRVKYDYLVKLKNCEVVVRAKSTSSSVSAKIVRSTCERRY